MIIHRQTSPEVLDGERLAALHPLIDICEYIRWFDDPSLIADWKPEREPAAAFAAAEAQGLKAHLFKGATEANKDRWVLAFEPTKSVEQWKSNLRQAFGQYTPDYQAAQDLALLVKQEAEKAGKQLVLTGNSRGGGEAMFAAAKARVPAVAFNPASLGPKTQEQLSLEDVAWADQNVILPIMKHELLDKLNRAAARFADQAWVGTIHTVPQPEGLDRYMMPQGLSRTLRVALEGHTSHSLLQVVRDKLYRLDPHFFTHVPKEVPVPAHPVIAHRGSSNEHPENTLPAFRAAFAEGADGIEMDIHMSADGKLIVHHDATTNRQTGAAHRISQTPWETLRKLDAGKFKGERFAGTPIPLLEEVLAELPAGKKAYIEIKGNAKIVPPLLKLLRESGRDPKQFTIISFSLPVLAQAHKQGPEFETLWIPGERPALARKGFGPFYVNAQGGLLSRGQIISRAKAAGVTGIDIDASQITARQVDHRLIREAQAEGLKVAAWTVDSKVGTPLEREAAAAKIRRLNSLGAEVTTNAPGLAWDAIRPKPSEIRQRHGIILEHAELRRPANLREAGRLVRQLSRIALYV
ncbi:MAG: glycerophosphodiester phosphodiesterase family protein [Verrucomicrobium sp.]|nr:glycerophosphodiester phosphodiesterase family protein [Verrucomicrobium sp.]